mmetsp:Transcript_3499/g.5118  ORF Transcript_3499/g.5118 Transcript_3499/m.5118 type:complete len:107 (-) Transcript_3499:2-322(-)
MWQLLPNSVEGNVQRYPRFVSASILHNFAASCGLVHIEFSCLPANDTVNILMGYYYNVEIPSSLSDVAALHLEQHMKKVQLVQTCTCTTTYITKQITINIFSHFKI